MCVLRAVPRSSLSYRRAWRASHREIVARSAPVLKFLAEMGALRAAHLDVLWRACVARGGGHEASCTLSSSLSHLIPTTPIRPRIGGAVEGARARLSSCPERAIAAAVVERAGRAQSTIAASRHHAASHRRRASSFWWFGGLSFARLWWGWWRRLSRYKAELVSELGALLAGLVPALSAGHLAHLLRAVHASLVDPDAAPAAIQVRYAWCGVRRRRAARRRRRAPAAAAAPASGSQPARRARVPRRDCAREGRSTPLERNPSERRGHHPH
jgi:hypothetical protein